MVSLSILSFPLTIISIFEAELLTIFFCCTDLTSPFIARLSLAKEVDIKNAAKTKPMEILKKFCNFLWFNIYIAAQSGSVAPSFSGVAS